MKIYDGRRRYLFAWIVNAHHLLFYIRLPALRLAPSLSVKAQDKLPWAKPNSAGEITIRLHSIQEAELIMDCLLSTRSWGSDCAETLVPFGSDGQNSRQNQILRAAVIGSPLRGIQEYGQKPSQESNLMTVDMEAPSTPDGEEIEGVDVSTGDGWGDYPLDAVFVRTEQRTVGEVVARIAKNRYILDPDFQRDFVWANPKQSKLIESCVMRIPLPVFYVAEAPDGRIIVVDGLQRLTTFARFLGNELRLTGLVSGERTGSHELEGRTYEKLPLNLQERVSDTQLTMYILDAKAPERARLDIFERVNSGAQLTRQQMRNALYNGPATQWLKSAAEGEPFQTATAGSLDSKAMRDREAINRFCAFSLLGWESYTTGDMDSFLAQGLKALAEMDQDGRNTLRAKFDAAMSLSQRLFGQHAFRKSLASDIPNTHRSVINISLFEVSAVMMSRFADNVDPDQEAGLREVVAGQIRDEEFGRAITYSTNSTQAVRTRFGTFEKALESFKQ